MKNKKNNELHIHRLFNIDPWKIQQNKLYTGDDQLISESLTSIGNGRMGMRGNFEEKFSGASYQGSYLAGVWFPEPTKVAWWKNGYPDYFGKTINSTNYIGFDIKVDGVELDLNLQKPLSFTRTLDLRNAILSRSFTTKINNKVIHVDTKRILSLNDRDIALLEYSIKAINPCRLSVNAYLDANIKNYIGEFANQNKPALFWDVLDVSINPNIATVTTQTKPNNFNIPQFMSTWAMKVYCSQKIKPKLVNGNFKVGYLHEVSLKPNDTITFRKFISVIDNRYEKNHNLNKTAITKINNAYNQGFDSLWNKHIESWNKRWDNIDVKINGNDSDQQAIRYNLFQLLCTYDGFDDRLNIGPKGFTGEKYGGATYWDTESVCLPVYLGIDGAQIPRSLMMYRFNQLSQAKHNAHTLSLDGALYPMVTFDGIESHNEWEITMEEIHRNNTISFAVHNYYSYTNDNNYLFNEGLQVLIEISRFWASRVSWSKPNKSYVILGVTGPNEFEHNVDNNWYTNYGTKWTLKYTLELLKNSQAKPIINKLHVRSQEIKKWTDIVKKLYLPYDKRLKIFLQQDNFLNKDIQPVTSLKPSDRPIVQKWSWDRILRSCYIKQADVLQGLYYWYSNFSTSEIKRNYQFYEPITVHESSLSPCIHSILASRTGMLDKATEMYERTARLDLDNINNDTKDGLHITSMSGSWLAIVHGFAGLITTHYKLEISPQLPKKWNSYSFKLHYLNHLLNFEINKKDIIVSKQDNKLLYIWIYNKRYNMVESLRVKTYVQK